MQVHGFLAQAALLNAAAGRSPYGGSPPAFSDTRPTYSRDAQDEETPNSDISGASGFLPPSLSLHDALAGCLTLVSKEYVWLAVSLSCKCHL